MVEWHVGEDSPQDQLAVNVSGYFSHFYGPLTFPLQQAFPHGSRSRIFIDPFMLSWLQLMTTQDAINRSQSHCDGCTPSKRRLNSEHQINERSCSRCFIPYYLLVWRYRIAETLVHEFGHALHNAAYGNCYELPLAPGSLAEAGFELCNQLFGGIIHAAPDCYGELPLDLVETSCNGNKPRPIGPFGILIEWPNTGTAEIYTARDIWVKPLAFKPQYDIVHRIPFSYFEDLFSAAFWERVSLEGPQALKPPMKGTWCFRWKQSSAGRYHCCSLEQNVNRLATKSTDATSELKSVSSTTAQTIIPTGIAHSRIPVSECQCSGKRKRRLSSLGEVDRYTEYWYEINGVAVPQ